MKRTKVVFHMKEEFFEENKSKLVEQKEFKNYALVKSNSVEGVFAIIISEEGEHQFQFKERVEDFMAYIRDQNLWTSLMCNYSTVLNESFETNPKQALSTVPKHFVGIVADSWENYSSGDDNKSAVKLY